MVSKTCELLMKAGKIIVILVPLTLTLPTPTQGALTFSNGETNAEQRQKRISLSSLERNDSH